MEYLRRGEDEFDDSDSRQQIQNIFVTFFMSHVGRSFSGSASHLGIGAVLNESFDHFLVANLCGFVERHPSTLLGNVGIGAIFK